MLEPIIIGSGECDDQAALMRCLVWAGMLTRFVPGIDVPAVAIAGRELDQLRLGFSLRVAVFQ